jgi:hypothetical protein
MYPRKTGTDTAQHSFLQQDFCDLFITSQQAE